MDETERGERLATLDQLKRVKRRFRSNAKVICGDCRKVMAGLDEASVDAIVCDPPYGLSFMGKGWDHGVPGVEFWEAALRVLKPGGHLVAFGGTRTFHRLTCAIEDAGFEVRDCLSWLYGTGFPKSLDVSKAIDKAAGAEREKVQPGNAPAYQRRVGNTRPWMDDPDHKIDGPEPVSDAARRWRGWGTALKPAWEPIVLARKPLAGTVAANVLEHGTGALNVDGTRIGSDVVGWGGGAAGGNTWNEDNCGLGKPGAPRPVQGRWPANVVLDEEAAAQLGEPSRFFYCAKASKKERGEGNNHPTVKPVALTRWLCRLVTPPGGLVLDPFCGSGSTGVAAREEGFDFVGIDLDEGYCEIARRRIESCES